MSLLVMIGIFTLIGYLLGSFSSAVVVCKSLGLQDPRKVGSGNPGATNVLRHGSKAAAALTLLLDVLKGVIAVLVAIQFTDSQEVIAGAALGAFLGHLFPLYFGFRGGKGVATGFGAITVLSWQAGLLALGTWIAMALVFRYSSLSALTASLFAPMYVYFVSGSWTYTAVVLVISSLLIYRHRSNIQNLMSGQEDKIWGN